jgi:hypothetical protein
MILQRRPAGGCLGLDGPLWTDRGRPGFLYADAIDGGLFVGRFE